MIFILACVFVVLMLVIGGDRGAISLITLVGNILVFIMAVVLMSWELNPILITLIAGVIINGITLFYQNGRNEKTIAASISVFITTIVLLGVIWLIGSRVHLEGLNEIELRSDIALYYSMDINVNMSLVVVSMILIGMAGAIMDMAIAISSAVFEVYQHNKQLSRKELFQSGLAIGKDVLGTTLNTLYFAYIGEAILLILYMRKFQYTFEQMLNSKALLQEIVCILFSGIGCVITIPLCSYISAYLYVKAPHVKIPTSQNEET